MCIAFLMVRFKIISVQLNVRVKQSDGLNNNRRNLPHFVHKGVLDLHNIGLGNLNVQSP